MHYSLFGNFSRTKTYLDLLCVEQEAHNTVANWFTVAIVKDETSCMAMFPVKLRALFSWHFIEQDGTVTCEITGRRRHAGTGLAWPDPLFMQGIID